MSCRADLYAKAEIPASFIRHIDHQKRWIAERQDDLRQILDHLEVVISSLIVVSGIALSSHKPQRNA